MQAIVHCQRGATEAGDAKEEEQDLSGLLWNLQTYGSSGSHGFTAYGSLLIHMDLQNMTLQWFKWIYMDHRGSMIILDGFVLKK